MPDVERQADQDPARSYVNDVLNFEKYVVPGACAVGILVLFPWYMLGGGRLATWDLATVAILTLVAGHVIESLKVYQWAPIVSRNFKDFRKRVDGTFSDLKKGQALEKKELVY